MEITIILIVVYILFYFSSRKESNAFDQALKSRPKSEPYFFEDKESSQFTYQPTGTMPNFGNPLMSAKAKHQYLQSPEWRALKQTKLIQSNHKCELCSSTANLHLHHLTYDRLGNELITDLAILCGGPNGCHNKLHKIAAIQHPENPYGRLYNYPLSLLKNLP